MTRKFWRDTAEWALMLTLVLGVGAIARADNDPKSDENVVTIGHADGDQANPSLPSRDDDSASQAQAPKYWIGLLGGAIPAESPLRAQLDLPEQQGLIVVNVVPDSPAAKAGLKQYDILLRANDRDLHKMPELIDLVQTKDPIKLDVLRKNKHEAITLTPEERPANAPVAQAEPGNGAGFGGGQMPLPNELLQQFGGNLPQEFRNFGPGVIVGGGPGVAEMPNGVSISVQKQTGQPTHITVTRGSDTWNITGDDPESMKQLPEDLRPFVEGMVHGGGRMQMPKIDHNLGGPGLDQGKLRERMERMEQRLEEMQKQLSGSDHSTENTAEKPESSK